MGRTSHHRGRSGRVVRTHDEVVHFLLGVAVGAGADASHSFHCVSGFADLVVDVDGKRLVIEVKSSLIGDGRLKKASGQVRRYGKAIPHDELWIVSDDARASVLQPPRGEVVHVASTWQLAERITGRSFAQRVAS